MPLVANCPRCTSPLVVPGEAQVGTQLECPVCEVEFAFESVASRQLLQARLVEYEPTAAPATAAQPMLDAEPPDSPSHPSPSVQENLSRLLRDTANWTPAARAESAESPLRETFETPELDEELAEDQLTESAGDQQPHGESPKSGPSRLDQLLSDLMKRPADPLSLPPGGYEVSGVYVEEQFSPSSSAAPQDIRAQSDEEAVAGEYSSTVNEYETPASDESDQFSGASEYGERSVQEAEGEYADDEQAPPAFAATADDDDVEGVSLNLYSSQGSSGRLRKMVVGVVGAAVFLLLLNYALLWMRGPQGDFFAMASWAPAAIVPADYQPAVADVAAPAPSSLTSGAALDAAAKMIASQPPQPESSVIEEQPPRSDEPAEGEPAPTEPAAQFAATRPRYDAAVMPAAATAPIVEKPPARASEVETWPTTPVVGDLRGIQLYPIDELRQAVANAAAARQEFLAGDLARLESRGAMGKAYMDVAALAERFTLTDPAAYGNELITEQMLAKETFRAMAGNPARRADLTLIAARWLEHEGRQNQGAVLLGRVRDMRPQGPWTEYVVEVSSGDVSVQCLVLLDRIRFPIGAEVAVVGVIVPQPQKHLVGYQGDAAQVVVAGFVFSPEDFTAPATIDSNALVSP